MKQLFIVPASAAIDSQTPMDLNGLPEGAIGLYDLKDPSDWLDAAVTDDFAIAYGRGANSPAIVIPEVNFKTLTVVKTEPSSATAYSAAVELKDVEVTGGENYTLVLSKLGVHFNERSNYTATEFVPINSTKDIKDVALSLAKQLAAKAKFENLNIVVAIDDADPESATVSDLSDCVIAITALDGGAYKLQGGDALTAIDVDETEHVDAVGDKAYVERLASMCAQNRGFSDTYADGPTTIPGYPMPVADTTYNIYTLRFAVPRASAKTRDEVVNQLVHIAVAVGNTDVTTELDTVLGLGD